MWAPTFRSTNCQMWVVMWVGGLIGPTTHKTTWPQHHQLEIKPYQLANQRKEGTETYSIREVRPPLDSHHRRTVRGQETGHAARRPRRLSKGRTRGGQDTARNAGLSPAPRCGTGKDRVPFTSTWESRSGHGSCFRPRHDVSEQ